LAGSRFALQPPEMFRSTFVDLPVHRGGAFIVNLHAVATHVAPACFRTAGDDHGQGDEPTSIMWPTFHDWKAGEGEAVL